MPNGTVKWFNAERGYGFITPEGGEKDIFVHHSNVLNGEHKAGEPNLLTGQKVEYEIGESRKGPQAVNVRVVE